MPSAADQRSRASSASSASPFDDMDDLLQSLRSSPAILPPAPSSPAVSVTGRPPRASFTGPSSIPPSTTSATSSLGGGITQGLERGEVPLFYFESKAVDFLCAGFIGGPKGKRQRFCTRRVAGGVGNKNLYCCDGHKGEKFPLTAKTYYCPMAKDSALTELFVTLHDLAEHNELDMIKELHTSKGWMQRLEEYHAAHETRSLATPAVIASGSVYQPGEMTTSPSKFNFDEDETDEVKSPSEDLSMGKSVARGARALRELSSSGIEAIKSILPVANLFGTSVLPAVEELRDTSSEVQASSLSVLVSSVESLLEIVPRGLGELDTKLQATAEVLQEELLSLANGQDLINERLFGSNVPDSFLATYSSVAGGLLTTDQCVDELAQAVEDSLVKAESAATLASDVDTRLQELQESLRGSQVKTTELIRAFVAKFNIELNTLGGHLASTSTAASRTAVSEDPSDLHFAGYHHRATNRFTTGRNLREYHRLTTNGWIKQVDFDSELDMAQWLRLKNSGDASPTPSPGDEPVFGYLEGGIAAQISGLTAQLNDLSLELKVVKQATLGSGVHHGKFSFDSVDEVLSLIEAEGISPNAFGVAVDAVSFFAHNEDGAINENKLTLEMKNMKLAGIDNLVGLRYINSFRHIHPSILLNSSNTPVKIGDRFPMLNTKTAWEGDSLSDGGNADLEKAISNTYSSVDKFIEGNLPEGRFYDLCSKLNLATYQWLTKVITYVNKEIKRVELYGIPEDRTLTLVSNQINTMFESMWAVRRLMPGFSSDMSGSEKKKHLAASVWHAIQCHMIMEEFAEAKFVSHHLISSVFVRFLAKETGANFSAGLADTIKDLKLQVEEVKKALDKVSKGISKRLDNHTENLKAVMRKADVKFIPLHGN